MKIEVLTEISIQLPNKAELGIANNHVSDI